MVSVLDSPSPPHRVTSASARSPFAEKTAEAEALKTVLAESGAFSRMMLTAEERVILETDFGLIPEVDILRGLCASELLGP